MMIEPIEEIRKVPNQILRNLLVKRNRVGAETPVGRHDLQIEQEEANYLKYRGKCKEMSEAAVAADSTLILVRGHYHCPIWGEQPHWWAKRQDGTVVDPTKDQFPSKGIGEYVEFNGRVQCSECGKDMAEEEASYESNYCFCSYECHGRFVGVF
jgi:hypothetical protein